VRAVLYFAVKLPSLSPQFFHNALARKALLAARFRGYNGLSTVFLVAGSMLICKP
jgi:hypothetical protein